MTAIERRMEILYMLVRRHRMKLSEIEAEFGISRSTAKRDVQELLRSFPLYTVDGRYGGIFIDTGYQLGMKYLTES